MKRLFTLLFLLFPITVIGQNGKIFNIYYKPDKIYIIQSETTSETKMYLKGDKSVIDRLNQSGSQFPLTLIMTISSQYTSLTGATTTEKVVPIKFYFQNEQTKTNFNNNTSLQASSLNGLTVEGVYINQNTFVPNPNSILGLDETKKQNLLKALDMSQNQITFPKKELKIGDQFTQNNTMVIPVSGFSPLQSIVTSTFTLLDTIDGIAKFKIDQTYKLDKSDPNFKVEFKGTGVGSAEYNIPNSFLNNQIIKSKISIIIKLPNVDMLMDLDNTINEIIKIK
jgi:hypothetical protein